MGKQTESQALTRHTRYSTPEHHAEGEIYGRPSNMVQKHIAWIDKKGEWQAVG